MGDNKCLKLLHLGGNLLHSNRIIYCLNIPPSPWYPGPFCLSHMVLIVHLLTSISWWAWWKASQHDSQGAFKASKLAKTLHTFLSLTSFFLLIYVPLYTIQGKKEAISSWFIYTHFIPMALWMGFWCERGLSLSALKLLLFLWTKEVSLPRVNKTWTSKRWSWILNLEFVFSEWTPNLAASLPSSDSVPLTHWTGLSVRDMQTLPGWFPHRAWRKYTVKYRLILKL